jgi:hypothetical protein
MIKNTIIYSAFCGTGKSYICKNTNINCIEIEYHNYKNNNLDKEYIDEINKCFGFYDFIFISTDPQGLKLLYNVGFDIILVYPKNELRNDYLDRYIERDSPYDFIGVYMKYWNSWIDELKEQKYCKHIILEKNQYLLDIIKL